MLTKPEKSKLRITILSHLEGIAVSISLCAL